MYMMSQSQRLRELEDEVGSVQNRIEEIEPRMEAAESALIELGQYLELYNDVVYAKFQEICEKHKAYLD